MFTPSELYFDNASTTRVDPRVVEAMIPYFNSDFGNSESLHSLGMRAHAVLEGCKETLAELLGADDPDQIIFVSGATEANNLVLAQCKGALTTSAYEHSSIRNPAKQAGARLLLTPPSEGDQVEFLCWIATNNETGWMWPIEEFSERALHFHSDFTQSCFKFPHSLKGVEFASASAHKFHGPKGIGFLYARDQFVKPIIEGGGQQEGRRSGTLPLPLIVGMTEAAKIAVDTSEQFRSSASRNREIVKEQVLKLSDVQVNEAPLQAPHIMSISFLGVEAESILVDLDAIGISIGTGSACSSKSHEPNEVLSAMGISFPWQRGTIRISFSKENSPEATQFLAAKLRSVVENSRQKVLKP